MKPLFFEIGDLVILKKPHPCGESTFRVLRTGADIRLLCTRCSRDLMLPREKAEKAIKQVLPNTPTT